MPPFLALSLGKKEGSSSWGGGGVAILGPGAALAFFFLAPPLSEYSCRSSSFFLYAVNWEAAILHPTAGRTMNPSELLCALVV